MFFRIFIILTFLLPSIVRGEEYILFISLDGFRYDYTENVNTPNLDYIESIGVKANSLVPVFPSLTFPNHFSMATGCYPEKHGLIGNTFFSKRLDMLYKISDRDAVENKNFYLSEPIWNTVQHHGKKSATYFWVGSEAPINDTFPNYYKRYDKSTSYQSRIDTMMFWFSLPDESRPDIVMLYFDEPDYTGHMHGTLGNKIDKSISMIDGTIGEIIKKIKNLDIYDSLNVIVASDHGMANVSKDRVIYIDNYTNSINNINIISEGSYMQLDLKNLSKNQLNNFKNELDLIPNIRYYFKDEIPNILNIKNSDTPDLIIIPDIGWIITSIKKNSFKSFINEMERGIVKGMHGYTVDNLEMHGIFYAFGPSFLHQKKIESIENIDIYPVLCKILDIPIENDIDGKIEKFSKVLK